MHSISNIPWMNSKVDIRVLIDGEHIRLIAVEKGKPDEDGVTIVTEFVGDHMLSKPAELRRMFGEAAAFCIRRGRDAGYEQARYDIRKALGLGGR